MLKTTESAARVLAPKVQGTLALEEALRGESLRCFVLFSSISSILAPAGQIDYAAANAFLDAFAQSRKGPVTVVNWGLWNDVGMGARLSSTHPMARANSCSALPTKSSTPANSLRPAVGISQKTSSKAARPSSREPAILRWSQAPLSARLAPLHLEIRDVAVSVAGHVLCNAVAAGPRSTTSRSRP